MLLEIICGNARLKAEVENMQESAVVLGAAFLSPPPEISRSIIKHSRDTALHLSC